MSQVKNYTSLIHTIITLVIMIGFGFLPAPDPITPLGMKVAGIFFGMVYGWTFCSQVWPSLFGLLLLVFVDFTNMTSAVATGWGTTTIILLVMIMIFAQAVSDAGVTKFLALKLINNKIFFGKPWLFSALFMFVSFFLSALVNTFVAILVCWSIIYDIAAAVGYQKGDKWPALMIMSVTVAAIMGMGAFPYKLIPLMVYGSYSAMGGAIPNYLHYVIVYWGIMLLIVCLFILANKYILKVDASKIASVNEETFRGKIEPLTKYQLAVLLLFVAMVLCFFACNMLPSSWAITIMLNKIGTAGIASLFVGIALVIKVDNKPLLDFKECAAKGVLWEPIILTACVLPVISALTASQTGIQPFMVGLLGPVFAGKPIIIFVALAVLFPLIITNFANNGVTALVFMAVVVSLATQVGVNASAMLILLIFVVHVAIMSPAACPMAGLLFGNTEWITQSFVHKEGIWLLGITFIVVVTYGYFMANLLL